MMCPGSHGEYSFGCTYITKDQLENSNSRFKDILQNYTADVMQICADGDSEDECNEYCSDECEEMEVIGSIMISVFEDLQ